MAKQYLTKINVPYEEIDVTNNGEGFKWILDHTGQAGVPVIRIGEETIIGFDRPKIDAALVTAKLI
jgi:glutaredoxin